MTEFPSVAQVVVSLPVDGPFDYAIPESMRGKVHVGQRVSILFNRQRQVGFVVGLLPKSDFTDLNPLLKILDNVPVFSSSMLTLTEKLSRHYGSSWGQMLEAALPVTLRKNTAIDHGAFTFSPAGKAKEKASLWIDASRQQSLIKIVEEIKKCQQENKSSLILVPDHFVMKALWADLKKENFDNVFIFHALLKDKEEYLLWQKARRTKGAIVLGARSAAFMSLQNLGLIVLIDEDNYGYKQEQPPHYHAAFVCEKRADMEGCQLIVSSAAPSATLWNKAHEKKWHIHMVESDKTTTQIVDMTNYNPLKTFIVSFPVQNDIRRVLDNKGRYLLMLNQKGYARRTHCQQCGKSVRCPRCNVVLRYIFARKELVCQQCQTSQPLPKYCPTCKGSYLKSSGAGIEKIESELARFYPDASIATYQGEDKNFPKAQIVVATQAVVRFQSTEKFDVVAVLNFDAEIHRQDYDATHRGFALVQRLRAMAKEKLILQTSLADNYALRAIQKNDMKSFYAEEMKLRHDLNLPPYSQMILIHLRGKEENKLLKALQQCEEILKTELTNINIVADCTVGEILKSRDQFRGTLTVRVNDVQDIMSVVKNIIRTKARATGIIITLDVAY